MREKCLKKGCSHVHLSYGSHKKPSELLRELWEQEKGMNKIHLLRLIDLCENYEFVAKHFFSEDKKEKRKKAMPAFLR